MLAFALAQAQQWLEPFPPTPFDRVIPITIDAQDALLAGHGRAERVTYRAEFSGTLHLWTRSARELDLFLRIETPSGELVEEDDNSGGGRTPYVRLEVEAGREIVIATATARVEGLGSPELCAIAAPETEETRASSEAAQLAIAEVKRLRAAGDLDAARLRVQEGLDACLAVPAGRSSEFVASGMWDLGLEAYELSVLRPTGTAWGHALRHRLRTLPEEHPDLQAAQQNLSVTIKALGDLHGARSIEERVLEVRSRTLPEEHPDLVRARLNLASTIAELGDLHGARALFERALEVFSRTLPEEHPDLQTARLNLAVTMYSLGDLQGARALFERVLEVHSRTLPEDHPDLQLARGNLAGTIKELGDLQGARALEERVLEVYSRTLPEEHPDLQVARGNLAGTIKELGDLEGARALEERVLEVFSRTLPEEHPYLQRARESLAATILRLGDLQGARALFESVLEVWSRTLPEEHPELQRTRQNLAVTMLKLGDLQRARALFESVLEVWSRTLPEEHPNLQSARLNLAATTRELGDLKGARALFERVLEVRSRTLGEEHPDLQSARGNLALVLYSLGDVHSARALFERVLEVRSRTLPEEHADLQAARGNLALALYSLGDLQGARALFERVLDVYSRTLPEEHPDLQSARQNLAVAISALGDLKGARALQESVLEVRSRTLPEEHPDLQGARGNLASTISALGDLKGARVLQESVLEVCTRTLPEEHPDLQSARQNLAGTIKALGDLQGARSLQERVLEVRSRTLPEEHPDLQSARLNLAVTILTQACGSSRGPWEEEERTREREGGRERGAELLLALSQAQALAAREVRLSAPGREAEDRCASLTDGVGLTLSVALGFGGLNPCVTLRPAVFVHSESTRNAGVSSSALGRRAAQSEGYAEARAQLRGATDELARLVRAGTNREGYRTALSAREAAEKALLELGRRASSGNATSPELDLETLSAALDPGDAAIAYRSYTRWSLNWPAAPNAEGLAIPREASVESLCAFIVRPRDVASSADAASSLTLLDLGPLESITAAVAAWREALGASEGRGAPVMTRAADSKLPQLGAQVRQLVFDPLRAALGDARHVVFVLDGPLQLVPMDALPASDEGARTLGDTLRIETRMTLEELLESPLPFEGQSVLVGLGGVEFDGVVASQEPGGSDPEQPLVAMAAAGLPPASSVPLILRGGGFAAGFGSLPGTLRELEGLEIEFTRSVGAAAPVSLLRGQAATKNALLAAAPRARWLHIATHGWFAPESIRSWADRGPIDSRSGLALRQTGAETVKCMSPMMLCGLALAGANLPEDAVGRAPGLLTADELSTLDLSNCELAVLSACDTARGEMRRAGQGVASLQKALQIAGARSVITSLWKVPDAATKELMLDFYRRVWVDKKPKWKALWEAKSRLRDAKDERGEARYGLRDWAAWVLTGEPE